MYILASRIRLHIVSVIRLKKVSTSYECDTFLVGSRHLDRGKRYLFSVEITIFAT